MEKNTNVIYAYKKIDENKIVYIGQTVNLKLRDKRHREIDPWDEGLREYNYPLSRGIRKYGNDAYELIILEDNLLQEQLNEREKYWIAYYDTYYHGYNQSLGGANPVMVKHNEDEIDKVIDLLKNTSKSFQQIADECGISLTHVYNINTGNRRKRDNIEYPIRNSKTKGTKGLIFSQEEVKQIHEYILNNPLKKFKEIAEEFNCADCTIRRINEGKTKAYVLKGYTYPLRSKEQNQNNKGRFIGKLKEEK